MLCSCKFEKKKYKCDIPHRWNATYTLLKLALKQRWALDLYCVKLLQNVRHYSVQLPSECGWTIVDVVKNFLEVFDISTKFFVVFIIQLFGSTCSID